MERNVKKLKVAVIGCGRISARHMSSAKILSEYADLVAVCDIKKEVADEAAKKYEAKAYYDYKELIDTEELDVIHICLPHYLHMPVAKYAIERGVKVLTEKPMGIDFESAEEVVKLAEEKNVLFGVIFQCRYNNSAQLVKRVVSEGKLGKILSAHSTLTWSRSDDYYSLSDWKGTWDKEGGGVIIDQAIHSIDLANWIINSEVESISCTINNRAHKIVKVEDTGEGLIKYKNGTQYSFYCMNNYAFDEPIEIKMFCEKGKVVFGYNDAYVYYNDGTTEEAHQDKVTRDIKDGKDYWGYQHVNQIEEFYKAALGLTTFSVTGKEALKTHKLICEIYKKGKETFKV